MTKLLYALGLSCCLVSFSQAQTLMTHFEGCSKDNQLFFAYTHSHNNAVELCQTDEGYRFSYGPLKKPHTQFVGKDGSIGYIEWGKERGFAAQHNNKTYWLNIDEYAQYDLIVSQPNIHGRVEWAMGLESYSWGFNTQLALWELPKFAYIDK